MPPPLPLPPLSPLAAAIAAAAFSSTILVALSPPPPLLLLSLLSHGGVATKLRRDGRKSAAAQDDQGVRCRSCIAPTLVNPRPVSALLDRTPAPSTAVDSLTRVSVVVVAAAADVLLFSTLTRLCVSIQQRCWRDGGSPAIDPESDDEAQRDIER